MSQPGPHSPAALLKRHGLAAKKSWGQCFLHDPAVVRRIVELAALHPEETVVEIGAGLGELTLCLAGAAARVIAVERDREMLAVLEQRLAERPNVTLRPQNALELDLGALEAPTPLSVVGNLPYNIASPLLFHLLDQAQHLRAATLMVQKEVAQRLCAPSGSRTYGAPSVLCQARAEVRYGFTVGRGAFYPAPRVDSAVVKLTVHAEPRIRAPYPLFRAVVRAAFGQRRKTLRRALRGPFSRQAVDAALEQAGLEPTLRAERLEVEQFDALARALAELGASAAPEPR